MSELYAEFGVNHPAWALRLLLSHVVQTLVRLYGVSDLPQLSFSPLAMPVDAIGLSFTNINDVVLILVLGSGQCSDSIRPFYKCVPRPEKIMTHYSICSSLTKIIVNLTL